MRTWLRPRTSSDKQRRPQCDSSSDAECHPLLEALQTADVAPTPQLAQAAETTIREVAELASRWAALKRDASTLLR